MGIAIAATVTGVVAGVIFSVAIASIGLPTTTTVVVGIEIGLAIGYGVDKIKKNI